MLTLSGFELPDGSIGVLETNTDLVTSRFEFIVSTVPQQANATGPTFLRR